MKEKRKVCRSLIDKTRHRFNVSVSEVDTQDIYQTLTIGIALVSGDVSHVEQSLDKVINFMDEQADAELVDVEEY
ncbi:MAG: DUF503 domain-containing protein [Lachnospiraceae bacterium]|nr:DUF503 domain-containing protein [Lachnospiraceae bacterium]